MKKTMAYKHKGMKLPKADMTAPQLDQSSAPKHSPSMQHKEPSAQYQYPKSGEQSMKPDHTKKGLPSEDAPTGTAGVNGGSSMSLPKSGGLGDTEV